MSIDLIAQPSFLLELGGKKGAEVSIPQRHIPMLALLTVPLQPSTG